MSKNFVQFLDIMGKSYRSRNRSVAEIIPPVSSRAVNTTSRSRASGAVRVTRKDSEASGATSVGDKSSLPTMDNLASMPVTDMAYR